MAYLQTGPIDSGQHVRSAAPESAPPVPPGIYIGTVTRANQVENQEKGSLMLVAEITLSWPEEYNGHVFTDRFNIMNQSEIATRIGKEQLADLALACGYPVLEDDDQLLGQEVFLELFIEPAKPYTDKKTGLLKEGKPQNKCGKYWHRSIEDVEAASKEWREGSRQNRAAAAAAPSQAPVAPPPAHPTQQPAQAPAVAAPAPRPAPAAPAAAPAARFPGTAPAAAARPAAPPPATGGAPASAPWKRPKQ